MFTTMLAHAKMLALAGLIGGGAAYATHAATNNRPTPQNQQWQDQDQGGRNDQNRGDQQRQPLDGQDFNQRLNRRVDQQVDRHLDTLLSCSPHQDFHRGGHFDRR